MINEDPDRRNQAGEHEAVSPKAVFSSSSRPERLGEGYDEHDRRLDAALTTQARHLFQAVPGDLEDRLFASSMAALEESSSPYSFSSERDDSRSAHAIQRLALAACLGLAVVTAWWLVESSSPPMDTGVPMQAGVEQPQPLMASAPVTMNAHAEWAMLASTREHQDLQQLSTLVATRDMAFSDFTGDLSAILDAMQNPHMQAFDVEWQR